MDHEITLSSQLLQTLESALRVSTPLLLAAMGGLISERSGVINIALEGMMLIGAFTAATVAWAAHSPWAGAFAAMVAGIALAVLYGFFVIRLRADQIVTGIAINMLVGGVTPFLSKVIFESTSSTASLPIGSRFGSAPLVIAGVVVMGVAAWLRSMPSGIWVRFAGESPEALDSAGISVSRVRWAAVLTSGALAALGGATLSIYLSSAFSRNMTAGRGFMALAAVIFGKWRPIPTALACLLFGFAEALQIRLQGVTLWGTEPVPVQFIQILPYVITTLVLAGLVGRSQAPKALGMDFR